MCIDVQTLLAGDMCCFEFSGALDGWSSSQGILYIFLNVNPFSLKGV
jgi:hypothetical protein